MKKLYSLFIALLATIALWAYDFQSGDLYYNITSSNEPYTVEVTYEKHLSDNNYSGLTSAVIPATVTYSDTTYTVTSVGESAFSFCISLTSVIIPNSVTSIRDTAFCGCSIESITIPNSVTSIGAYAFCDCSTLSSITIPNNVTSIGDYAFFYCPSLTSVIWNAKRHTDLKNNSNLFLCSPITSFVFGDNVEYIPKYLCYNISSVQSVTVGNNVTTIGEKAFFDCSNLKSVIIGNSVTSIENRAFKSCSGIKSITILAETPPSLGDWVFDLVQKSIPVYVPCGCVAAYKNAGFWSDFLNFQEPTAEYSIAVSTTDSRMGYATVKYNTICGCQIEATPKDYFHFIQWSDGNCENPRSLKLNQDTILVAEFVPNLSGQCGDSLYYFYNKENKTLSITGFGDMYDYTTSTQPWLFFQDSITILEIGDSVTSIGNHAFSSCSSLTFVTIGNSVTSIGHNTFKNCPSLISISWEARKYADAISLDSAPFYDIRSQITSFTVGCKVQHLSAYLCSGMEKLTSVTIPNSVKTIGTSAFEGCVRLGKISLGTGLEKIAANAFAECKRLYDIYTYATYPPFAEESSFANYNVYVYIPCEYQRDYTLDVVWGEFKFIKCIDSEDATTDGNVTVDPGYNDVTITWPTDEKADSYSLVINKAGEPFCTLTFNADGQLLNIAFAPGRSGSHVAPYALQTVSGYRFTVTGLTEATKYAYDITTKDAAKKTIAAYSGEFRTRSVDDRTVMVEYDAMQGKVIGAGTYLLGDTVTLTAIPNEGYQFVTWGDGNTDNPRTLVVTQDTTLTALFEALTYNVMVTCDPIHGSVIGSGTYNHGDVATLTAIPNDGYRFVRWSNEVEDNPYTFVISDNVTLSAEFEVVIPSSLENTESQSPTIDYKKILHNGQLLIIREGKTYNVMGQEM